MNTLIVPLGFFCLGVGVTVLSANPRRLTSQVFAFISVLVACWVWSVAGAIRAGELFFVDAATNPHPWLRANGVISAFMAWALWLLNESIVSAAGDYKRLTRRALLLLLAVVLPVVAICCSDLYIPDDYSPLKKNRGVGYHGCVALGVLWHTWLLIRAKQQLHRQSGIRRVEMQFLSFNLGIAMLLVILVTGAGNWLELEWLRRLSLLIFLGAFGLAAWAITFHRIFNARQIMFSLLQRVALVLAIGAMAGATWQLLGRFIPTPFDFVLSIGLCVSAGLWLDKRSREWLQLGNAHAVAALRQATIQVARTEPDPQRLIAALELLLRKHCDSSDAALLFDWEEIRARGKYEFARERPGFATLAQLGWATPETLNRRSPASGVDDLQAFLREHALTLVVAAPRGSTAPTLVVALGAKRTGWPFTYPEVQCVQEVAELMDNILARSRLATQAAVHTKMEHLALMSRGLAHDLKNLITPISSYLVHTRPRCEPGSAEEEVHAAARRSVSIIAAYVREAAFFANRLTPRVERITLGRVFQAAQAIVGPCAARRGISIEVVLHEQALWADAVLLQRLLVNVVNNAIDAVRAGESVRLHGGTGRPGWIKIHVCDDGCGIAPEHRARIFEPYFTTKEFGDEVRGFGLGLTICQKIVHLHHGTIAVESEVGVGTTVTIELPQRPPEGARATEFPATAQGTGGHDPAAALR